MRINPTTGYEARNVHEDRSSPASAPRKGEPRQTGAVDGSKLGQAARPYLQKARELDEANTSAVEEARSLIASGELDTPDAARAVAEALLNHGV